MPMDLYTVFERDGEQVGISEFGDQRALIRIRDGGIALSKHIQLHDLGPHIAALNRSGFTQIMNGAFFNERVPIFSERHPDFYLSNDYLVFVQAPANAQEAVTRIEAIGLKGVQGEQRKQFNEWLRSLDLCCGNFVAPSTALVPVLALCEFAFDKSLCIYSSIPCHPVVAPSADMQAWAQWLSARFDVAEIGSIYSAMWSSRLIHQSATGPDQTLLDLLSCQT